MFFKKNKHYIFVILIILISLFLIYYSALNRENSLAYDNVISFVVRPVTQFFAVVADKSESFLVYFGDKKKLSEENARLKDEMVRMEHENAQLQSLYSENERLRALLDIRSKYPDYDLAATNIISRDSSNYYSNFLIDKGTADGLALHMPVIGTRGLIGYIVEAGNHFSRVQTIIDGGSSVGCIIIRTGNASIVEGNATLVNDGLMSMTYVSKDMGLVEGDLIETSGLGQIYPAGILIGRIKQITLDEISKTQYTIIEPAEEFDKIREVYVVTDYEKISG